MNNDYRDYLISKYNAEDFGRRLSAVVDGKKQFIAELINDTWTLNSLGMMLEGNSLEPETLAQEAQAPRRRGRPPKAAEVTQE